VGIWISLILAVFILAAGGVIFSLYRKVNLQKEIVFLNLKILQNELEAKQKVLGELAQLSLSFISADAVQSLKGDLAKGEDSLRGEKGKATILAAEMEAVDVRLRELEEIERELEASGIEAGRELEMLRVQERDIESRNGHLFEQLESCAIQLDQLLNAEKDHPELVAALTQLKADLNSGQMQLKHFQTEIPDINKKYVALKQAYDALDIEYAQLYEKQSQAAAAS